MEGHFGKSERRISEAWISQNLVALREREELVFLSGFYHCFQRHQVSGWFSFIPHPIYGVPAVSQALPNSMSYTISGSVGSISHNIYFPWLPIHSKAKFSPVIPKVYPRSRRWARLRVPVSTAHTPTQREGSRSSCCVPACTALGTRPTAHGGSCAKIQVTSWRWLLSS